MASLRIGMAFGCFIATVHLVWAILIAIGWAQPLLDFIFWVHMLNSPFQVQPFSFGLSCLLVGVTWAVGFCAGFVFATIWKRFN